MCCECELCHYSKFCKCLDRCDCLLLEYHVSKVNNHKYVYDGFTIDIVTYHDDDNVISEWFIHEARILSIIRNEVGRNDFQISEIMRNLNNYTIFYDDNFEYSLQDPCEYNLLCDYDYKKKLVCSILQKILHTDFEFYNKYIQIYCFSHL